MPPTHHEVIVFDPKEFPELGQNLSSPLRLRYNSNRNSLTWNNNEMCVSEMFWSLDIFIICSHG